MHAGRRRIIQRCAGIVFGLALLYLTAEPDNQFYPTLSGPWRLRLHSGIKTVNGLHRVKDLRAEIRLDGESTPRQLDAQVVQPPAWSDRIEGPKEEVVVNIDTRFDPAWRGHRGVVTYDYTLIWPQVISDAVEHNFFPEKSE